MDKHTEGPWETWGEPTHDDPSVKLAAGNSFVATTLAGNDFNNATAIAAAVNYLRSHGAAIAELVKVARQVIARCEANQAKGEYKWHDTPAEADYKAMCAALRQVEGE